MGAVLTTCDPARPYINEWTPAGDGRWIHKYSIISTPLIDFAVWEPYHSSHAEDGAYTSTHSTITTHNGVWLGDITTRTLPAEIDALPRGEERIHAVRAWYAANKEEGRVLVKEAYPQDFE